MSQFDYQSIIDNYRQLHEDAQEAQVGHFDDILEEIRATREGVSDLFGEAQQQISGVGETELNRLEEARQQRGADAQQDLISRGLASTTMAGPGGAVQRGVDADIDEARADVREQQSAQQAQVTQQQAAAEERLGQFLSQAMERQTPEGPDLGMMSQLMQRAGAGVGAQEAQEERPTVAIQGGDPNAPFGTYSPGGADPQVPDSGGGPVGGGAGGGSGARVIRGAAETAAGSFGQQQAPTAAGAMTAVSGGDSGATDATDRRPMGSAFFGDQGFITGGGQGEGLQGATGRSADDEPVTEENFEEEARKQAEEAEEEEEESTGSTFGGMWDIKY